MESASDKRSAALDVVTSDYHVARTTEVFRHVFPGPIFINVEGSSTSSPALACEADEVRSLKAFRETFAGVAPGDLSAIHARLSCCHPFYNGDVYSKIGTLESISRSLPQLID
jgi:hypothetical protein